MDVMLDLETWGLRPGCALRSIGAVVFDPYSKRVGTEFYCNVELESCKSLGMHTDQKTIEWWMEQSIEAQAAFNEDQVPITEALHTFGRWFTKNRGLRVWSQGANFDEPLLSAAFHLAKIDAPWKFYNASDTRTIYEAANFDPRVIKRAGTYHNALDDAKHQVRCIQESFARITGRRAR